MTLAALARLRLSPRPRDRAFRWWFARLPLREVLWLRYDQRTASAVNRTLPVRQIWHR